METKTINPIMLLGDAVSAAMFQDNADLQAHWNEQVREVGEKIGENPAMLGDLLEPIADIVWGLLIEHDFETPLEISRFFANMDAAEMEDL